MNLMVPISTMKEEGNWPLPWISAKGLVDVLKHRKDLVGCELGVSFGFNLVYFLENLPNISKVYAIDPYQPYDDPPGGYVTEEVINQVKSLFLTNIDRYQSKVKFLNLPSDDAHFDIPNNTLDYIFIDGDHSYQAVKKDMSHYYSKVKTGGVFAGHDVHLSSVRQAVEEFRTAKEIKTELLYCDHNVWYWVKDE